MTYLFDACDTKDRQEYKLYQCARCEIQIWWPLKFMPEFYEKYLPKHEILSLGDRSLTPYAELFFNLTTVKSGQLLDVGCGDGAFIKRAKEIGFHTWGIDMDSKCIDAAKNVRNLDNVFNLYLEEFIDWADNKKLTFDIISIFEVLEHQDNPSEFIKLIKRLLKPGGIIVGSVPNRERLLARLDWKVYMGDFPPPHLTRWSKRALQWFLEHEGLTQIELYPVGFKDKEQLISWYKRVFLRNLPSAIKGIIFRNKKSSSGAGNQNESGSYNGSNAYSMLKKIENVILMPIADFSIDSFNKRGAHLYFQCTYLGGNNAF